MFPLNNLACKELIKVYFFFFRLQAEGHGQTRPRSNAPSSYKTHSQAGSGRRPFSHDAPDKRNKASLIALVTSSALKRNKSQRTKTPTLRAPQREDTVVVAQRQTKQVSFFIIISPVPKDRGMLWFYVKAARRPPPAARNGVNAITQKPWDGLFSNLVYTLVVIVSWPD